MLGRFAFNSGNRNTTYDCGGGLFFSVQGYARGRLTNKLAIITTSTDVNCYSFTENNLKMNGGVNIDTTGYVDTIVIRRPTVFSDDANFYVEFR
jgi:hypothetical protein